MKKMNIEGNAVLIHGGWIQQLAKSLGYTGTTYGFPTVNTKPILKLLKENGWKSYSAAGGKDLVVYHTDHWVKTSHKEGLTPISPAAKSRGSWIDGSGRG